MIAKEDILELLSSTESYRVERTVSTGNMDKFDNYIEVMNAGGLYGEARPENFPLQKYIIISF